jgi:hypothetical protein
MTLHCGSVDGGSGGTVILEAHVLELVSSTGPSNVISATTVESRLVSCSAW